MAQTYVTQRGDTLWDIAEKFYKNGSLWHIIYEANRAVFGDNPGNVFAGKTLTIPDLNSPPPAPPSPPGLPTTYTTKPNDTLWELAERFYQDGTKWYLIYEANKGSIGSDPRQLPAGLNLTIPTLETAPNQPGGDPQLLGGTITDSPDGVYFPMTQQFHVYCRSTGGSLFQHFGTQWQDLGKPPVGFSNSPAAVVRDINNIDVFVRGNDNNLYHIYWGGTGWYGWENHGGGLQSSPTVCSWSQARLDIFARGGNNNLIHCWWDANGGWSQWEDMTNTFPGGFQPINFNPAAVSWGPNRIDIFATRMGDGHLIHSWWDGTRWNGWEDLGGLITEAPSVVSRGNGLLDVFGRGSDGAVYQIYWDGSRWSGWIRQNMIIASAPAAVVGPQGTAVFARSIDNQLQRLG